MKAKLLLAVFLIFAAAAAAAEEIIIEAPLEFSNSPISTVLDMLFLKAPSVSYTIELPPEACKSTVTLRLTDKKSLDSILKLILAPRDLAFYKDGSGVYHIMLSSAGIPTISGEIELRKYLKEKGKEKPASASAPAKQAHQYFPAELKLEAILAGTVAFTFDGKVYFADLGKNLEDKEGNPPEGYTDLKLLDANEELGIAVLQNSRVAKNDPNSDCIQSFQVK